MALVNPHIVLDNEKPKLGYKMVTAASGLPCIATLQIPPKSTVVKTSYRVSYRRQPIAEKENTAALYRTNDVIVESVIPLNTKKYEPVGFSMKRPTFKYVSGAHASQDLGSEHVQDGNGIHFFTEKRYAMMWTGLLNK